MSRRRWNGCKKTPRAYLSHELLTRDWEAFSFGEVAGELSEAKLAYVGSAYLTDSVDRLNFTEAQQAFLAGLDDSILREETRDMLLCRQFRRDVFAKGVVATSPTRLRDRWLDTRFAMTSPAGDFDMTFETPVGKLQLRADVHGPLIALLREGPVTLREAIGRLPQTTANWASIVDVIKGLVGRGDLQPALPAEGDAARMASVRAFNDAVLARAVETGDFGFLASPVTGGGVAVDRLTRLYLLARLKGVTDPTDALARLAKGAATPSGDAAPLTQEAAREVARKQTTRIESDVVPMLQRIGIA
jgi:hypothetical protein